MTLNITEPTVGGSSGSWGTQLNDALTAIVAYVNTVESNAQPVDADLTAIAALTTTAYGRSLLTQANAAAAQTVLGLGSAATQATSAFDAAGAAATAQATALSGAATDATAKANAAAAASQPLDSDLTAIAALTTTSFGRSFLDRADAAAARTLLGLGGAATLSVGTTTGTVAAGDDTRITGAVPATRTVNGKALSANVTLAASDVGAATTASVPSLAEKSAWTTATAYAVGDAVNQGGYRYLAKTAHTSGTFATDKAANWTLTGLAADDTTAPTAGQVATYNSATGKFAGGTAKYLPDIQAYNLSPNALAKWRLAYATQRNGGAPAKILMLGDSIMAGGVLQTGDLWAKNYPGRLRAMLDTRTGISGQTGILDANATPPTGNAYGFRPATTPAISVSTTGTWAGGFGGYGFFEDYLSSTAGSTYTVTWTGTQTLRVHTARGIGGATNAHTTTLDGSASTSITNSGSGILATDFTPTGSGAHTVVITVASSTQCNIVGLELRYLTGGGVTVHNAGFPSKGTTFFVQTVTGASNYPLNQMSLIAPDLTIIGLGTNDQAGAQIITPAAFQTNMQTLITAAKTTGDALLVVPPRDANNGAVNSSGGYFTDYYNILYALCDSNNIALVDLYNRYSANPASWMDGIGHFNDITSYDAAAAIYALLTRQTG